MDRATPSLSWHFGSVTTDCSADFYAQPAEGLDVPRFSPIYKLQLAIWQLRPLDLQKHYPLHTPEGRLGFLGWCVFHGRREYQALRELTSFWKTLAQPAVIPPTPWSGGISRFMHLLVVGRPDLGIDPQLATEAEQLALLRWFWFARGYRELGFTGADIPEWQKRFLLDRRELGQTRLAQLAYIFRPDLQRAFPLRVEGGRERFAHWVTHYGLQDDGLRQLATALIQPTQAPAGRQPMQREMGRRPGDVQGVNLIGYAYGELGIGEDVRMAAHALHAAGVPFTVINFAPGADIRQGDRSIEHWVGSQPLYPVNIVCLTALEHLRFVAERGWGIFEGRYNIGYWPWELQNWPTGWAHCLSLVDEVWASSEHIRQALAPVSPVPLLTMPMAVFLPEVSPVVRAQYDLPEDDVLFVFSFDGNSSLARKNPLAVVKAFQQAFPGGDEAVGLVIKCMRPDAKNPAWKKILAAAKADSRIHIVNAMLSKPDVLGLYRACDCFVSLHRAEGYGRGIAEALLLDLDVIATGYGGNVDFCRPAGASLVPYGLVPVGKDDYVEASGQNWAEPDVATAACLMQAVARERHTKKDSKNRRQILEQLFSPSAIGVRYRQRLLEIDTYCVFKQQIELDSCLQKNPVGIDT